MQESWTSDSGENLGSAAHHISSLVDPPPTSESFEKPKRRLEFVSIPLSISQRRTALKVPRHQSSILQWMTRRKRTMALVEIAILSRSQILIRRKRKKQCWEKLIWSSCHLWVFVQNYFFPCGKFLMAEIADVLRILLAISWQTKFELCGCFWSNRWSEFDQFTILMV